MSLQRVPFLIGSVVGLVAGALLVRFVWMTGEVGGETAAAVTAPRALNIETNVLSAPETRRLTEVLGQIRREYVDEVADERLVEAAMRGMLAGLDEHSAYLDRREYEEIRRGAAGNYPGIGIEVIADNGFIKVQRPLEDSPAARAGILAGDLILRIDGEPVGANLAAAIEQMRGPAGSLVKLTVRRAEGNELVEVALERARVDVHSVSAAALPATATRICASLPSATPRRRISRVKYSACAAHNRSCAAW